jgi:hypothetical protein
VSHLWFYLWLLFLLGCAGLLWVRLRFPSLGRCAAALVLYLGVHTHYWWWVRIIFWLAIIIGVGGALWYHARNDRRLPFVSNDRKVSWRDSRVKRFARTASIVALAIPVIRLVWMLCTYMAHHWSWTATLILIDIVGFIAVVVLLLLGRWVAAVVLAIVALTAFASAGLFGPHGTNSSHGGGSRSASPSASTSTPATDAQKKYEAAILANLTVNSLDVANLQTCSDLVTKYYGPSRVVDYKQGNVSGKMPLFDVGATHPLNGSVLRTSTEVPRLWSDAVNTPLKTPPTLEGERAAVCQDPAQAAMVLNGIGPGKVGGISVASQNPWMSRFQGLPQSHINAWAQMCLNTQNIKTLKAAVHLQCAQVMASTAALLDRFHSAGVSVRTAGWYYYLPGGGLAVGRVPVFGVVKGQYSGYFLVIEVTMKVPTQGCYMRYGFNVGKTTLNGGDQRLVGLPCVPPKPPKKPTAHPTSTPTAHETTTPVCKSNCPTTTTHPRCTTTRCTTTHPRCTSNCPTTPPKKKCPCVTKTQVSQTPLPPPPDTRTVPTTAPSRQPTKPVDTQNPATNRPGGYDGGSTTNPVVTGNPTPADTGQHTAPIPTPTSGPFG